MQSRYHFLVSTPITLYLMITGEYIPALLVILTGWLIDADHEIDYRVLRGKFILNPLKISNELGDHLYVRNKYKMFVPLHGWEWLILGIILKTHVGILISYFLHLLMDVVGNGVYPQDMSLIWRYKKGWKPNIWSYKRWE